MPDPGAGDHSQVYLCLGFWVIACNSCGPLTSRVPTSSQNKKTESQQDHYFAYSGSRYHCMQSRARIAAAA